MYEISKTLDNLDDVISENFSPADTARVKTLFFKHLAEKAHSFYKGKMQSVPKAGIWGFNWFNVWYTPGVSRISTTIRDDNNTSYYLSNRGNNVGIVSDSTRVLGDGDCTPPGGLGVMEGKAFLMKYLGGVDATALCIDSRDSSGRPNPDKIIDFVKMVAPSFGAINLEDISQPNCYKVLDTLREECDIPVWHDDAQGTACVTLAGLINALKLAGKKLSNARITLLGAGASNTTIARILITAGADPFNIIICDSKGTLHADRHDIEKDPMYYRKWELCRQTNPDKVQSFDQAVKGADVLIALSKPGPDTITSEQIRSMNKNAIVFVCANPIPEIYPYAAKEAGAFIVATGRGDFPNQVNNSVGFPGILKGALLVNARRISDGMAIAAANAIASYSEKRGITPENITATMQETEVFHEEAAAVAMQAQQEGLARISISREQALLQTAEDIRYSHELMDSMLKNGFIKEPSQEMIRDSLEWAIKQL